MGQEYRQASSLVSLINYHFVWIPKRRRKILQGRIEKKLKLLIEEKATQLSCKVIALEIMPDHVHLFLNCPPKLAPSLIIAHIKGFSSKKLREQFICLKHFQSLWAPSFFVSSAGNVSSETIERYIQNQKI